MNIKPKVAKKKEKNDCLKRNKNKFPFITLYPYFIYRCYQEISLNIFYFRLTEAIKEKTEKRRPF